MQSLKNANVCFVNDRQDRTNVAGKVKHCRVTMRLRALLAGLRRASEDLGSSLSAASRLSAIAAAGGAPQQADILCPIMGAPIRWHLGHRYSAPLFACSS